MITKLEDWMPACQRGMATVGRRYAKAADPKPLNGNSLPALPTLFQRAKSNIPKVAPSELAN